MYFVRKARVWTLLIAISIFTLPKSNASIYTWDGSANNQLNLTGNSLYRPKTFYLLTNLISGYSQNTVNRFTLQPFLGMQVGHYHLHKTRERGTYPIRLTLLEKNQNTASSSLGPHLTGYPEACWGFSGLDCSWPYLLTSKDQEIQAYFQGFGDSFTLLEVPLERNSIEGSFFVYGSLNKCWNIFAKVSRQKWQKASTYNNLYWNRNFLVGILC